MKTNISRVTNNTTSQLHLLFYLLVKGALERVNNSPSYIDFIILVFTSIFTNIDFLAVRSLHTYF